MYFAYFDESGDPGFVRSPTSAFTLACVLVHESQWLPLLDALVFARRDVRDRLGVAMRTELKANWLIHGRGDLESLALSRSQRMGLYRKFMRLQARSGLTQTFAIVIRKDDILVRNAVNDPRARCWQFALQRLERFGNDVGENIKVFPDEGHGAFIQRKLRAMRRFSRPPRRFGVGTLERNAENILEDASDRSSTNSYFIQLADLNAYAAYRTVFPVAQFGGGMWTTLGSSRVEAVNHLRGGPTGIVSWPDP